ncbi:MAG TPA: DNA replication/repair protein RecF [Stellaceae bacterium]|jgi:DNA replication and repair protein RecF|nr:DNA replication/repair protein RecF [Stellaceae bacterium]
MLAEAQEARSSAGAAAYRVGATRLVLTDFRNYRDARLTLGTEPVVLTGPNGAGKTNLLEAVSLLAPGRGLRGARLAEIDRWPDSARDASAAGSTRGWAVAAVVATRRGGVRIGTGRDVTAGERRVVRIDGEPARSQAELGERLGIVWLTPAMDRLFIEGPGGRRRFLDRLVLGLDPSHASRVAAYEQAHRERSRLLREGVADPAWLGAVEQIMAEQGVAVAAGRREAVDRLDRVCAEAQGTFPRARLRVVGTVEEWLETMPALSAEAKLAAALAGNRQSDAQAGITLLGPHRSDLRVSLAEKEIAAGLASTGEQKALLISIILAHARLQLAIRGEPPLLLLDEVAAHLDPGRRAALFDALLRLAGQAWLTGTDEALFAPLRREAQFLSVRDGNVAATFS